MIERNREILRTGIPDRGADGELVGSRRAP